MHSHIELTMLNMSLLQTPRKFKDTFHNVQRNGRADTLFLHNKNYAPPLRFTYRTIISNNIPTGNQQYLWAKHWYNIDWLGKCCTPRPNVNLTVKIEQLAIPWTYFHLPRHLGTQPQCSLVLYKNSLDTRCIHLNLTLCAPANLSTYNEKIC